MVGLGQSAIPPIGWGAVEILIWDYKQILEKMGHELVVVNTPDRNEIIRICNSENPDFIHVQYDVFWDICESFDCKNVAITSHYGYIDQENKYDHGYRQIFNGFLLSIILCSVGPHEVNLLLPFQVQDLVTQ
jgi:hypothetical protein